METFVNRDEELALIEDAVDTLLDKRRLLRTPIIEFYGVEGIGKTSLLRKVEEKCHANDLPCIWAEGGRSSSNHFIRTTQKLLEENGPVVVILDCLDAISEEQLPEIEAGLSGLIENSELFVVMASSKAYRFDNARSITRKLTTFHLKPLTRESCKLYLDSIDREITPEIRDIIFDWTRGYPLAMDVMVEAILTKKLDPRIEQGQKKILSILTEKVINQSLLSRISAPSDLLKYQTLLSLLSVPRRFNLVIMQDIIEKFARDYKLGSSLAYITLPNTINEVTNVLSWNMLWAGYCIDAPVRNIFLLRLRIEQPQDYVAIHEFLAQINKRFALEVSGSDRVRYLREYFYHLAKSSEPHLPNRGEATNLSTELTQDIEQLIQKEPLDFFLQFYEEFSQDQELKETLGENTSIVLSFIRKNFVNRYKRDTAGKPESERISYLRDFFSHTIHNPKDADFSFIFEQGMRQIIQEESPHVSIKLYNELLQDEGLRALLGKDFDRVVSLVFENLSREG